MKQEIGFFVSYINWSNFDKKLDTSNKKELAVFMEQLKKLKEDLKNKELKKFLGEYAKVFEYELEHAIHCIKLRIKI